MIAILRPAWLAGLLKLCIELKDIPAMLVSTSCHITCISCHITCDAYHMQNRIGPSAAIDAELKCCVSHATAYIGPQQSHPCFIRPHPARFPCTLILLIVKNITDASCHHNGGKARSRLPTLVFKISCTKLHSHVNIHKTALFENANYVTFWNAPTNC